MAWVASGWVQSGWIEMAEAPPEGPPALIDLGTITVPKYRLPLATAHGLTLQYLRASSPYAPFDLEPIFFLLTPYGLRAFGRKQPREGVATACFEAFNTLVDGGPLDIRTSALGQNLVGSLQLTERPSMRVTIRNTDGWWHRLMNREAVLSMPAALYLDLQATILIPFISGTVGSIELIEDLVEIFFGDFRRHGD